MTTNPIASNNPEKDPFSLGTPEKFDSLERSGEDIIEQSIDDIHQVEVRIQQDLNLEPNSAESIAATDEALVHIAERTISSPESTLLQVEDVVEDVVIESALEIDHGINPKKTPINILEIDGYGGDVSTVLARLHETHATLPSGHEAAPLVLQAVDTLNKHPVMTGDALRVEYIDQSKPVETSEWFKNSEDSKNTESSNASTNNTPPYGGIHTMGNQENYNVSRIPIALPIKEREGFIEEDLKTTRSWSEMSDDEKQMYAYEYRANADSVSFESLKPEVKQTILARRLFELHAKSKDPTEMLKASERNRARVETKSILRPSDLTHSTSVESLPKILAKGLIAGELLGKDARNGNPKADRYPFNLDVGTLPEGVVEYSQNYESIMKDTHQYGELTVVIDRSEASTDFNNEVRPSSGIAEDHRLIFGGVASSEVVAICVLPPHELDEKSIHNANEATRLAVESVLEHGQYIPVLDRTGKLVLTFEEFEKRRATHEYGDQQRIAYEPSSEMIAQYALPGQELTF